MFPCFLYRFLCTVYHQKKVFHPESLTFSFAASLTADIRPHSGSVVEGETAYLHCDVKGYPAPSVHWEKDSVMVTDSSKMYVQGNALVITRVGIEDAGLYACVATNPTGKAKDVTTVQVKLQSE